MKDLKSIFERLKTNEEIARRFHTVETKILSILNFVDLFETLLTSIMKEFKVPYVWLSLIKNSELTSLLQSQESSDILKERLNLINRNTFIKLVGNNTKPILANKNLKLYFKFFPKTRKYLIKSIAVVPIFLDGKIVGSLNQADISPSRFQPGLDTSLLEHLAVKVSLCLSNVAAHEKLRLLANRDPLTGLFNRRVMEDILKREFDRAIRYKKSLSVIFIDLDDFKNVNDTYGHDQGDDLLKYVAEQLIKMSREIDVVARFAGDEFVVILPETSSENAENLMSRFVLYLSKHPLKKGKISIAAAISFGVASTEDKSIKDPLQLLKKADKKLYRLKKQKVSNRRYLQEVHN